MMYVVFANIFEIFFNGQFNDNLRWETYAQFPQQQLPKSFLAAVLGPQTVLVAVLGPLAQPRRSARTIAVCGILEGLT